MTPTPCQCSPPPVQVKPPPSHPFYANNSFAHRGMELALGKRDSIAAVLLLARDRAHSFYHSLPQR